MVPVQGPIIADAYPIQARARVFAVHSMVGRAGGLIAPLAIGGAVALFGGNEAWRWGFLIIAGPIVLLGIAALFVPDPPRGQFEQISDDRRDRRHGEGTADLDGATYQRIMQIRTYKNALLAFTAVGFSFVAVPLFINLYLDERFGLERVPAGARRDRCRRARAPRDPARREALRRALPQEPAGGARASSAGSSSLSAILVPIQMAMPNVVAVRDRQWRSAAMLVSAQFTMIAPLFASVNPYYLRAQGTAIGMALDDRQSAASAAPCSAGCSSDAFGLRFAIIAIAVPDELIGGLCS